MTWFYSKIPPKNLKNTADLLLPSASRSLPTEMSDWLLYQQGLIMLPCWQQICTFHFFRIDSPNFWVTIWKVFRNSSVMNSLIVCHISYEYLQEFPGYGPFCSENILIFSPSRRFSAYNFIYRTATSVILSDM